MAFSGLPLRKYASGRPLRTSCFGGTITYVLAVSRFEKPAGPRFEYMLAVDRFEKPAEPRFENET